MRGSTSVITLREPVGPLVYADFWSAFGLVSKSWGEHRLSFRAEYFKTSDEDNFVSQDDNNEHGYALTGAYIFRPAEDQRITVELVYVNSLRPERVFLGTSARARELQSQISYRFFF